MISRPPHAAVEHTAEDDSRKKDSRPSRNVNVPGLGNAVSVECPAIRDWSSIAAINQLAGTATSNVPIAAVSARSAVFKTRTASP